MPGSVLVLTRFRTFCFFVVEFFDFLIYFSNVFSLGSRSRSRPASVSGLVCLETQSLGLGLGLETLSLGLGLGLGLCCLDSNTTE